MPRKCTVCDHPERHSIDETLVTGAPYRSVAKQFVLSESAVYRHKVDHLRPNLRRRPPGRGGYARQSGFGIGFPRERPQGADAPLTMGADLARRVEQLEDAA
jgi:hypothetical protein